PREARVDALHSGNRRRVDVDEVLVGTPRAQIEPALERRRTVAHRLGAPVSLEDLILDRLERAARAIARAAGGSHRLLRDHSATGVLDEPRLRELRAPSSLTDGQRHRDVSLGRGDRVAPIRPPTDDPQNTAILLLLHEKQSDTARRPLRILVAVPSAARG